MEIANSFLSRKKCFTSSSLPVMFNRDKKICYHIIFTRYINDSHIEFLKQQYHLIIRPPTIGLLIRYLMVS